MIDAAPAPNAAYVLYMFGCLALFALVHLIPALDLRGVGRVRRRRPEFHGDEAEFADTQPARTTNRPEAILLIPRADLAMIATVLAVGAVLLAGLIGFLGPRLLDQAIGRGESWFFMGDWSASEPLERVAQVTGALCGGLIALRMLRLFMALAALLLCVGGALIASNFVLGRPML